MPIDEIRPLPDEGIGKMPIREGIKTESIEQKTRCRTVSLVYLELGQAKRRVQARVSHAFVA